MIKGVIFDIDGTLVDSNDAHAQSLVDTFAKAGYDVPFVTSMLVTLPSPN